MAMLLLTASSGLVLQPRIALRAPDMPAPPPVAAFSSLEVQRSSTTSTMLLETAAMDPLAWCSTAGRRTSPRMMAAKKGDESEGFVSEQGSAAQVITWSIALGIWGLIFAGIAKHAAGS